MTTTYNKDFVLKANVDLHTQLASVYNKDEPHWRPENIALVRSRLEKLKTSTNGQFMLDIGCGTGFMVEVARPLGFKSILGMDITPKMIEQVDTSGDTNVELVLGDVSQIPKPDQTFDVATAYSFIDHLYDMETVFKEVNRTLKAGGVFYAGLIPNEHYWSSINQLDPKIKYSESIDREIQHVSLKDSEINQTYGVNPETFKVAEFQKNIGGGLSEETLRQQLLASGFKRVEFVYDWFLGQRQINANSALAPHEKQQKMDLINGYLRSCLPVTKNLFKYLSFYAYK